jgi:hypothetical protein
MKELPMRILYVLPCFAFLWAAALLPAQAPPTSYSITQTMMGDDKSTLTIYRSGMKVLMEANHPASDGTPATHTYTFYDLAAQVSHTWDPSIAPPSCSVGRFSGDWGDPFAIDPDLSAAIAKGDLKPTADVTMYGIPTKLYTGAIQGSVINVWLDQKDNLVIRVTAKSPGTPVMTMANIIKVSLAPPPAALVAMPAYCASIKPPPTPAEAIAAETGDDAANFANANYGPGSQNSCSIVIRVVASKTMAPVTRKWQAAIDTTYKVDAPPAYTFGVGEDGTSTFSGGGMHEITSQIRNDMLRIDNPPAYFNLALNVLQPHHGTGDTLIYRQCSAPVTMLYYVLKDPSDPGEGGDFLYAKAGKYVAVPSAP